jgi:hypothetical protein
MNINDIIPVEEVRTTCQTLGLRDWTKLDEPIVLPEEAAIIRAEVGAEALMVSEGVFRKGLEIELEHGVQFPDTNVTNNHPVLTGMIVTAHLKESLDYYQRLEIAELEGDLYNAVRKNDSNKVSLKYKQLVQARLELAQEESMNIEVA